MIKKNGKKILVVDDSEATRYAIVRTLNAEGYTILEAANGEDALRLTRSELPDLITLDIHLPDIIGFEVCRILKLDPRSAHIPILQVSASYVTSKDWIHGLEGGADSYLTHPFEPAVLLATVRALLRSRQLHDDLRISEERFRVAFKNAPIMIYTMDRNLIYTWIYNPPLGLNTVYFLGKADADLYPPEEAEKLIELKQRVLSSGVGELSTLSLTLCGTKRFFDMTIEPFRGADGELSALTIACIDVTERLRFEQAQKSALEEAELASQAKTRFLANMSHEIRTPLGVIQGFADLLLEPSLSIADRNAYLMTIKRNAHHLTQLLGEILDLAKVEAGLIEIEKTQFSLSDLLEEVVETLSFHASGKNILLELQVEEPFPEWVESDQIRLRQVLMNLVNNALKFTEKGGVKIRAGVQPRASADEMDCIEIIVQDTGIGLALDQQKRLFSAFMQADSSTTRKYGGTGLGLNLSKKLAKSLGGDLILVSSESSKGSTFKLTLNGVVFSPQTFSHRRKLVATLPSLLSIQVMKDLLGKRILIVEDSIDNQTLFSQYLRHFGASVDLAADGLEATVKVRESHFDIILMDIQMPNMDGYEATRILRLEGYKTPIIAITAHALKEERDSALNQGFTDYLTKPVDRKLLVEVILRHCYWNHLGTG